MRKLDTELVGTRAEARLEAESRVDGHDQPPPTPQRFRFKSGGDNHVVARLWDGTNEGVDDFLLSLPPQVRKDATGTGYTYSNFQTRTRNSDGRAEAMFPLFVVDGDLWAVQVSGGTGVQVSSVELTWMLMVPLPFWGITC